MTQRKDGDGGILLLSNPGRVRIAIAEDPPRSSRQIADVFGLTERSAFATVDGVHIRGVIVRGWAGHHNTYQLVTNQPAVTSRSDGR